MRKLGLDPIFPERLKVSNLMAGYGAEPAVPPQMPAAASPAPNFTPPKVQTSPLKPPRIKTPRLGRM
jgi:hypothetical protein